MQDQNRHDQMLQLVGQWQQSGKSQRAFAAVNSINYYTFRYWVDKFPGKESSLGFIQLNTRSNGKNSICVRYPNGIEIYLPANTTAKTILQLIRY
jgi:hypothetical protein